MEQYNVTGMSCAASPDPCRKSRVKGTRCHILRSQPSDKFHGRGGNGLPAEIIAAVENAYYGASKKARREAHHSRLPQQNTKRC